MAVHAQRLNLIDDSLVLLFLFWRTSIVSLLLLGVALDLLGSVSNGVEEIVKGLAIWLGALIVVRHV